MAIESRKKLSSYAPPPNDQTVRLELSSEIPQEIQEERIRLIWERERDKMERDWNLMHRLMGQFGMRAERQERLG